MKAKISEIFKSAQGEGLYVGQEQLFVRFSGCNCKCSYCDTPSAFEKEYTVQELKKAIEGFGAAEVLCLTGGEPLCQADFLEIFLPQMKPLFGSVYLETNGVLGLEFSRLAAWIRVVAMDFKIPSITKDKAYWQEHENFLTRVVVSGAEVFIKMVLAPDLDPADLVTAAQIIQRVDADTDVVLQPAWEQGGLSFLDQLIFFKEELSALGLKRVKVMPQAHRYAGIR